MNTEGQNTVPTVIPRREIKPIDPKQFGQKAELKEKLLSILKDVPVLHQRLLKVTAEFERLNSEFKEATDRAKAIVEEWERLSEKGEKI